MRVDDEEWARGRGWALWKALLVLESATTGSATQPDWSAMGWVADGRQIVGRIIADLRSSSDGGS